MREGTDFNRVVEAVVGAVPRIEEGFADGRTYADEQNPSGQKILAADERADEILHGVVTELDCVGEYASEEREDVIDCGRGLSVGVDPLDGSSNLVSNNLAGVILGAYDTPLPCAGENLLGAAYVVFGPLTTAVVADKEGVTEYVIEGGELRDSRELRLPEPTVYGFGGGRESWTEGFRRFAEGVEHELKLRYGGSMVGDVNQVMHRGGVFSYPALDGRPDGKLRLLFEGAPMAYIVESAGGGSSDGDGSLLEKRPEGVHEKTPVHLGNESLIERLEQEVTG